MSDHVARLIRIIELLCRAVALHVARMDRGAHAVWLGTRLFVEKPAPSPHKPIPRPVWLLLALRATRLAQRFQILVQRWQTGTLPRLRPARPRQAGAPAIPPATRGAAPAPPKLRLPNERGWINRRLPAAAQCAGLLEVMLHAPDLARFHAEVPRAGRLLRPLAHALGLVPPPWLALPRRPRPAAKPAPAARPASPATPPRPLQPYVRSAARAWNPDRTARRALKKFDP